MPRPNRLVAVPLAAAVLVGGLAACGEQTPGGTKVSGSQRSQAPSSGGSQAGGSAPGAETDPKAADPIVVKIGNDEFQTIMAIYHKYDASKSTDLNLQQPKASAVDIPGGGKSQEFVSGNIYWSQATGARIVRGQILKTYLDNGGPTGKLGYPTGDETKEGTATYSQFQNGRIQLKDMAIQVLENAK